MAIIKAEREELLRPLQIVASVAPSKASVPVLGNILVRQDGGEVTLTASDIELQVKTSATIGASRDATAVTVPARKLIDLVRALPAGDIVIDRGEKRLTVRSGKSSYRLQTLPAEEFPMMAEDVAVASFTVTAKALKAKLKVLQGAMAVQDIRYYLNGMLFEIADGAVTLVTTDGHRLSAAKLTTAQQVTGAARHVVPRKSITELIRLLPDEDELVDVQIGNKQVRFAFEKTRIVSKVIDGAFPDYSRVIPNATRLPNKLAVRRDALLGGLTRAAIVCDGKFRGVKLAMNHGEIRVSSVNSEQEEAQETVEAALEGGALEIGFNVDYLIEAVRCVDDPSIKVYFNDPLSSALMTVESDPSYNHVLMPFRM